MAGLLNHSTLRANSDFMVLFFALYSTHHEGKTFPRDYKGSFEKWQKGSLIIYNNTVDAC